MTRASKSCAQLQQVCDLVTDGTHDSPRLQAGGVPFIKGKHISSGRIDFETCDYISYEDHVLSSKRVLPRRNDILFSNIGSVADIAFVDTDETFSIKNVALLRANRRKIIPKYLYYLMLTPEFREEVLNVRSGAAQPFISLASLRAFEIRYHQDLELQQQIVATLAAYDDLIEINLRRIRIHEEIARALYREWFVKFRFPGWRTAASESTRSAPPDGWMQNPIRSFGRVVTGKTPSKANAAFYGSEVPFVKTPDMHGHTFILGTSEHLSSSGASSQAQKTIPAGSICVSCIGTIGVVSITTEECQTNQQINSVVLASETSREFLFFRLEEAREALENLGSNGATMGNVNKSKFEDLRISCPPDDLLTRYHQVANPIFAEMLCLQRTVETLRRIRDLLLPRLMSGQIDLEGIEPAA